MQLGTEIGKMTRNYSDADAMHGKMFADAKAQAYASSASVSTFN